MRLQPEVEVLRKANSGVVDDETRNEVLVSRVEVLDLSARRLLLTLVETILMTLSADYESDWRTVVLVVVFGTSSSTSKSNGFELVAFDHGVLVLADTVAVEEDLGGKLVVLLVPQVKSLEHHLLHVADFLQDVSKIQVLSAQKINLLLCDFAEVALNLGNPRSKYPCSQPQLQ